MWFPRHSGEGCPDTLLFFPACRLVQFAQPSASVPIEWIDLNRAPAQALERQLPQLSPERRQRLLRERQRAPFQDLADLQQRLQLPAAVVEDLIGKVRFGQGSAGPELPRSA